jgi:LuxR family maltose regulon positive regulatory protein
MHASGGLAAIDYERGDLASARAHADEAAALADAHDLSEHWASSLSLAVRGQLLERAGDLDAADLMLSRAVELAQRGVASIEIAYSLLNLAEVRRRMGLADAQLIEVQARDAVRRCEDAGILRGRLTRLERPRIVASSLNRRRAQVANDALSDAELSVLRLLRSELSQREIASELHLSFNTIKTHTRSIYRKLGVGARTDAVTRARDLSLL